MTKYLDIFTDYGFKKIFGEEASKNILIDFLNALLPEVARIKDLKFRNTEMLGLSPINRNAVYDIYCENERGEKFLVELQNIKQIFYIDRTLFYSTFAIAEDAVKGTWDWVLKPVYSISILDFRLREIIPHLKSNKTIQKVTLKNEDGEQIYDKLTYIYIEIPNFNKTESELVTKLDKWLYFIKNLENFQTIPEIFKNDVEIIEAIAKAELAVMSDEDRTKYNVSLKEYRDKIAELNTAKHDGINEGIEIGIDKGIEIGEANKEQYAIEKIKQKNTELVKKCFTLKMAIGDIISLTGLSEVEIKNIIDSQR